MPDLHNPQQDPGTERRLLIAFALTFAVLLVSQPLLMKYVKPPQTPAKQEQQQPAKQPAPQPAATSEPAPAAVAQAAMKKGKAAAVPAAPSKQAASEQETVVENGVARIVFTNRGAQVKSWVLKQYTDEAGKPLDLVNAKAASQFGYPLSLWTYDEALRKQLADALYVVNSQNITKGTQTYQVVTFEYADGGLAVRKQFTFDLSAFQSTKAVPAPGDRYIVGVDTSVTQNGTPVRAFPAWPAGFGDQTTAPAYATSDIAFEVNDKVTRNAPKNVSGGGTLSGPFTWGGVEDAYFGAVFVPADPATTAMVTLHNEIEVPREPNNPASQKDKFAVLGAAAGSTTGATSERMFVGPKNLGVLESVKVENGDLRGLIDFGFWSFISRPLFLWLRWTHDNWVANWGVAIIILTIIINVVLFPLRLTGMKSAMKMQKLQPQMNAIKEKYKQKSKNLPARDPRKLELNQQQNAEIGALFKREGANPVGGCLPMLIQFPFLIAFYKMLGTAIELRNAHFMCFASFCWIKDLSSADPYHILPIGIIISMLLVQKMTPQAGMDPAQQKMMTFIMPVMMGVISWNLSAGLNLYWVAGNLIMIIQQYFMNRSALGREMRAEAEKRAAKKR
jgi:YidC/Oxa1 family membrane protein insertase